MGSEVIHSQDGARFSVGDARFRILQGQDPNRATTDDEIVILKPPSMLSKYDAVFSALPGKNVVEVGVAEGGSLIYLALAFPDLRFLGIDLRKPNPCVNRHIERLGLTGRIDIRYGIDQEDKKTVRLIIEETFNEQALAAVIDDASHFYEPSRKTFEATFGLIKPRGVYCIEDWAWAHEPGRQKPGAYGWDKASLSNLIFQITMLQPSVGSLVGNITIDRNIVFVERGYDRIGLFELKDLVLSRGRQLNLI